MLYRFTVVQKPILENAFRRLYYQKQGIIRKQWREAFFWEAKLQHLPPIKYLVDIVIEHEYKSRSCDTCACMQMWKSGQDGLIDAGLLPDDSPKYLANVIFKAPTKTGRDALTLSLVPTIAALLT